MLTANGEPPTDGAQLVPFQFKAAIRVDNKPKLCSGIFSVPKPDGTCGRRVVDMLCEFLTNFCQYDVTFLTASPAPAEPLPTTANITEIPDTNS